MQPSTRRRWATLASAAACASVLACTSLDRAESVVDAAAQRYHQQYNTQDFTEIYLAADVEMKRAQPEAEFVRILQLIHRKMGPVESAERTGIHVATGVGTSAGTRVTATFRNRFARGEATETLTWRLRGKEARLLGFNVSSPVLLEDSPPAGPVAAPGPVRSARDSS